MLTWDIVELLKVKTCVCVCAWYLVVPAGLAGRSRCELGEMKINRSRVGHMGEV